MHEATANVLVLGIRDFRAALCAVFRDRKCVAAAAPRRLQYDVNDHQPHVPACTMALLYVPQHEDTNAGALMYIWFSLRQSMLADAALPAAPRALTELGADTALWRLGGSVHAAPVLPLLQSIWCAWLTWKL